VSVTDSGVVPQPDRGRWFQTATGRAFYPCSPRAEEVFISDIAHALANVCRYGGHSDAFYSVGQHCLLVSLALAPVKELDQLAGATSEIGKQAYKQLATLGLEGLLHDAAEAYIGDMVSPLKHSGDMSGYLRIEEQVEREIARRFDLLPYRFSAPDVKTADRRMMFTEKRDLRRESRVPPSLQWEDVAKYPPYEDVVICPMVPGEAKQPYLDRFSELWVRIHGEPWKEGE
jgi:hypothetical protein